MATLPVYKKGGYFDGSVGFRLVVSTMVREPNSLCFWAWLQLSRLTCPLVGHRRSMRWKRYDMSKVCWCIGPPLGPAVGRAIHVEASATEYQLARAFAGLAATGLAGKLTSTSPIDSNPTKEIQ